MIRHFRASCSRGTLFSAGCLVLVMLVTGPLHARDTDIIADFSRGRLGGWSQTLEQPDGERRSAAGSSAPLSVDRFELPEFDWRDGYPEPGEQVVRIRGSVPATVRSVSLSGPEDVVPGSQRLEGVQAIHSVELVATNLGDPVALTAWFRDDRDNYVAVTWELPAPAVRLPYFRRVGDLDPMDHQQWVTWITQNPYFDTLHRFQGEQTIELVLTELWIVSLVQARARDEHLRTWFALSDEEREEFPFEPPDGAIPDTDIDVLIGSIRVVHGSY